MWKRRILAAAVLLGWPAAPCFAAELFAQLFPLTGEIRLVNRNAVPVPFVFYSITSASGALDPSDVWQSIAENYDAGGNGLIDPVHEWMKLSDASTELTEAVFSGPGGSIPATRAVSLGHIWDPGAAPFPDLAFDIRDDDQSIPVTIELAVDGDYSSDQVVDMADYVIWRRYVNSTTMLLADGNLDGAVNAADYQVWRSNYGITLPLPPFGSGAGTISPSLSARAEIVPEPASAALLLLGGWLATCFRRQARS